MNGISMQERYDEISKLSGLSEDVLRRAFKAAKISLATSLRKGERATLPGICTLTPEIRHSLNIGGESTTSYIRVKAKASSSLEAELTKVDHFETVEEVEQRIQLEESGLDRLNYLNSDFKIVNKSNGVMTSQINALL